MTGIKVNKFLSLTKAYSQYPFHSKTLSFVHNGLDITLKSLINLL
jgi:hypothetical protein